MVRNLVCRAGRLSALPALLLLCVAAEAGAARQVDLRVSRLAVLDPGAATGGTLRVRTVVAGSVPRARTTYVLSADRRKGRGDIPLRATLRRGTTALAIPGSVRAGAWRIVACADGTGRVPERSEGNNCRATPKPTWFVRGYIAPKAIDVAATADAGRARTASFGPAGGTLQATAADGTTFTLVLPAGALAVPDTAITMTPIAALAGVPLAGGLTGGVRLEPHGLQLYAPGVLTIRPTTLRRLTAPVLTALGTFDAGRDVHLEPSTIASGTLQIPLSHFSDHAAWGTTAAGLNAANARTPGSREAWATQNAARAIAAERETGADLAQNAMYVAQYVSGNERIGPLLVAAERDDALTEIAVREYLAWERANQQIAIIDPALKQRLAALSDRFRTQLVVLARRGSARAMRGCFVDRRPEAVHEILVAARVLQLLGVTDDDGATLADAVACNTWEVGFESRMTQPATARGTGGFSYHVRGAVPVPARTSAGDPPWQGPLDHVTVGGVATEPSECTAGNELQGTSTRITLTAPGQPGLMTVREFAVRRFATTEAPPAFDLVLDPGSPTQVYGYVHRIGSPCETTQTLTQPLWALYYLRARSLDGTLATGGGFRIVTGWQRGDGPVYATRTLASTQGAYTETTTVDLRFTPRPRP